MGNNSGTKVFCKQLRNFRSSNASSSIRRCRRTTIRACHGERRGDSGVTIEHDHAASQLATSFRMRKSQTATNPVFEVPDLSDDFWSERQDLNLRPLVPNEVICDHRKLWDKKRTNPRILHVSPVHVRTVFCPDLPASRRSQKSNKCGDSALMKRCGRLLGESRPRANRSGDGEGWGLDRLA